MDDERRPPERKAPLVAIVMKTVSCSCGYVAVGETGEELLADVEGHIDAAHSVAEPIDPPVSDYETKEELK